MLKYQIIPVTPFAQNCTLLWCDKTRQAAVVDPGGDIELIKQAIEENKVTVTAVLLTHGHLDHVGVATDVAKDYQVQIIGPHKEDLFWLNALPLQSQRFGLPDCAAFVPDRWLNDGDSLSIGDEQLAVFHCPGHTPGHVVFFSQASRLALVGDVIFNHGIGRTDFERGSFEVLLHSIQTKLWPLGDDVVFIPGHGRMSNIGDERLCNPYVGQQR